MQRPVAMSVFALAVGLCFSPAAQAQPLTASELVAMANNKTVYFEFAGSPMTGTGSGVIYTAADGKVSAKFPNGKAGKGTRSIKDNTTCITWEGQPPQPCSRHVKEGDKIKSFNAENGQLRGTITKVVDGNPEKL